MFEKNVERESNIDNKLVSLSLKDNINSKCTDLNTINTSEINDLSNKSNNIDMLSTLNEKNSDVNKEDSIHLNMSDKIYKSNINKINFLQTQLSGDILEADKTVINVVVDEKKHNMEDCSSDKDEKVNEETQDDKQNNVLTEENNITDDSRIAKSHSVSSNLDHNSLESTEPIKHVEEISISVPPRRKKQQHNSEKNVEKAEVPKKPESKEYPKHLNPFSEDEDEVLTS